ncbi:MAG: SUMF1/EgtB/PvdO family nonheme iron enzyme [Candidatus Eisenbacteria bacterium]|nr:SUMF1/EgtB/PvdO family nonheme iron enzyme [Candidatus Eisenbacteria bacterium]
MPACAESPAGCNCGEGGTCSSPGGAIGQRCRVVRGGSWNNNNNLRCANRNNNNPNNRNNNIGFRCARTLLAGAGRSADLPGGHQMVPIVSRPRGRCAGEARRRARMRAWRLRRVCAGDHHGRIERLLAGR